LGSGSILIHNSVSEVVLKFEDLEPAATGGHIGGGACAQRYLDEVIVLQIAEFICRKLDIHAVKVLWALNVLHFGLPKALCIICVVFADDMTPKGIERHIPLASGGAAGVSA
jgi:hypothetical protein